MVVLVAVLAVFVAVVAALVVVEVVAVVVLVVVAAVVAVRRRAWRLSGRFPRQAGWIQHASPCIGRKANTEHKYVYRMRQGWAGSVRELADGRNQFILIFLPGDLFAVKSMFVIRHPDAVAVANDPQGGAKPFDCMHR